MICDVQLNKHPETSQDAIRFRSDAINELDYVIGRLNRLGMVFREVGNERICEELWELADVIGKAGKAIDESWYVIFNTMIGSAQEASHNIVAAALASLSLPATDTTALEEHLEQDETDSLYEWIDAETNS